MHQNQNDPHIGHYERNFITKLRAMDEFLLKDQDLKGLRFTQRRSPNEFDPPLTGIYDDAKDNSVSRKCL